MGCASYVVCTHTHMQIEREREIYTQISPSLSLSPLSHLLSLLLSLSLSLSHTHTHINAVTLPPAQPVYIISSVWFCSLLNGMGIWDIFPALPPSLCLFLPLCLSVSLSPSSSFYLFFSPTPSYPFSHFLYHPSFVSQYFPCYKPLYLLLTTDFLSCLLSSIYVSCSFSFCIRRIMLCMFHVTMPTLHPRRPFKKPFEPLLSFISYPALSFLLHLSLNKVYSGVLPVTNT